MKIILPINFRQLLTLMTWSSNNWWEDSTWCIVTSKTGFAHTRSIINNKSSSIVVTHFGWLFVLSVVKKIKVKLHRSWHKIYLPMCINYDFKQFMHPSHSQNIPIFYSFCIPPNIPHIYSYRNELFFLIILCLSLNGMHIIRFTTKALRCALYYVCIVKIQPLDYTFRNI